MNTDQDNSGTVDHDIFMRLLLANEREIMRYVCALVPSPNDAEEIVQQTAILLWEKFDQYDQSRPFTPWACRFALNVSKQWMARRSCPSQPLCDMATATRTAS
jgi:DNA-directed RNA polymerase specialized sigma24 family protein